MGMWGKPISLVVCNLCSIVRGWNIISLLKRPMVCKIYLRKLHFISKRLLLFVLVEQDDKPKQDQASESLAIRYRNFCACFCNVT